MKLPSAFDDFFEAINPKDADYSRASSAHEDVRRYLKEAYGEAHVEDFLSGSYRRQTVLRGVKDVDVIHVQVIDTTQEPGQVLGLLLRRLRAKYGESNAWPQGRSVGIRCKGVDLDIVPAAASSGTSDRPLLIPDRDAKAWVQSHPKGQIQASEDRNRQNNFYKPIVKAVKHWRNGHLGDAVRPSSYLVEAFVYHHIPQVESRYAADALQAVFVGMQDFLRGPVSQGKVPRIPDPGLATVNVAKRWTVAEMKAFVAEVEQAVDLIYQALAEEQPAPSSRLWRRVLGQEFPIVDSGGKAAAMGATPLKDRGFFGRP